MPREPAFPAVRPGQRCHCHDRLADRHPLVVALNPVGRGGPATQLWVVADGGALFVCAACWLEPVSDTSVEVGRVSPGGRKTRWVTLVDGPRAGDRLTSGAFSGPDRSITLGVPVGGRDDLLDYHEYRLCDGDREQARWVGYAGRGPRPQGPSTPI